MLKVGVVVTAQGGMDGECKQEEGTGLLRAGHCAVHFYMSSYLKSLVRLIHFQFLMSPPCNMPTTP